MARPGRLELPTLCLEAFFAAAVGDAVSVHRKDLGDLALSPSGDLDFLEKLQIQN
jgi:hypothetical protein